MQVFLLSCLHSSYMYSVPAEHRYCVNLLKAYGVLSAILVVGDTLSLGAILAQVGDQTALCAMQPCFLSYFYQWVPKPGILV